MRVPVPLASLRSFRSDERASVTIEFVMISPLIMLWILGSYVFFDTYRQATAAAKATYLVGDIVSRLLELDDNDLQYTMTELFDHLTWRAPGGKWVRITSVSYDEDADQYNVEWSTVIGDPTYVVAEGEVRGGDRDPDTLDFEIVDSYTDGSELPTDIMPTTADGDSFILTESYVPFDPIISSTMWFDWAGLADLEWRNRVINRPRFVQSINNTDHAGGGT